LKAELAALEGKLKNYETVLKSYDMGKGSELEYLWGEGFELSEEGKKILRIKSKPGTKILLCRIRQARKRTKLKVKTKMSTVNNKFKDQNIFP
jgi:hypothetical protein